MTHDVKRHAFARALGAVHELPYDLPEGEDVLWQGAPTTKLLMRALHIGPIALYLALISAWYVADRALHPAAGALVGMARVIGLSVFVVALIAAYAWLVARNTSYTLTNRRLVLQIGIALPMSFNLPFARIESAAVKQRADGSGDITLSLTRGDRLNYVIIWPHARPWRLTRAEPMLRAVPDVARVARMLSAQLAASAGNPALATPPAPPAEAGRAGAYPGQAQAA